MAYSIEEKKTLLSMARAFRMDIQDIQQKGAGYYSCAPFVSRYNKLLSMAKKLFTEDQNVVLDSFDEVDDTTSVDPADKMKMTQRVIIELGQIIAFMESIIGQEELRRRAQTDRSSAGKDPAAIASKENPVEKQ
jgi:hypothetical protein